MLQEIIAYAIIALTAGFVIYSLFFKKKGCSEKSCDGCPYCSTAGRECPKHEGTCDRR